MKRRNFLSSLFSTLVGFMAIPYFKPSELHAAAGTPQLLMRETLYDAVKQGRRITRAWGVWSSDDEKLGLGKWLVPKMNKRFGDQIGWHIGHEHLFYAPHNTRITFRYIRVYYDNDTSEEIKMKIPYEQNEMLVIADPTPWAKPDGIWSASKGETALQWLRGNAVREAGHARR